MATDEAEGVIPIGAALSQGSLTIPTPCSAAELEADRAEERAALLRLVRQQLPEHLRHASFAAFDPNPDREALELTQQWVGAVDRWHAAGKPGDGPNVLLTSFRKGEEVAPGNGKTMLAAAALLALAERGVGRIYHFERGGETWPSLMWKSSADLIAEVRSTYNRNSDTTAEQVVSRYVWADVLALDDIGTEPGAEDATSHLFRLMDHRIGKPTSYTSNYSPKKLSERSPEWAKIVSRMSASLRGTSLSGPDRRKPVSPADAWGRWT